MLAPFMVTITIVIFKLSSPLVGANPASNTFATLALFAIVSSLLTGVISLFLAKTIWLWWRVFAGILYFPTTIYSLLAAGF